MLCAVCSKHIKCNYFHVNSEEEKNCEKKPTHIHKHTNLNVPHSVV